MNLYILLAALLVLLQAGSLEHQNHDFFFWNLGGGAGGKTNYYTLYFKYAARYGRPLRYTEFKIFWNTQQLGYIRPDDFNINHQSYTLTVQPNTAYTLKFASVGGGQAFGSTIDEVYISGSDGTYVDIKNWNFEDDKADKSVIKGAITGWTGKAEVGNGYDYNPQWCCGNQVALLDGSQGSEISQVFEVGADGKFKNLETK